MGAPRGNKNAAGTHIGTVAKKYGMTKTNLKKLRKNYNNARISFWKKRGYSKKDMKRIGIK